MPGFRCQSLVYTKFKASGVTYTRVQFIPSVLGSGVTYTRVQFIPSFWAQGSPIPGFSLYQVSGLRGHLYQGSVYTKFQGSGVTYTRVQFIPSFRVQGSPIPGVSLYQVSGLRVQLTPGFRVSLILSLTIFYLNNSFTIKRPRNTFQ